MELKKRQIITLAVLVVLALLIIFVLREQATDLASISD